MASMSKRRRVALRAAGAATATLVLGGRLGEEEMDVATELRSTIECVLHDCLQPAIRDLSAAAEHRTRHPG